MNLAAIYEPIAEELASVEDFLASALGESDDPAISAISRFVLKSPGKRIRPALVILSEKAAAVPGNSRCDRSRLIEIATAMELIHMASLIHDDVLDEAVTRHNMPTVNIQYGKDISIVLGDYVYAKAFQLIGASGNSDIFACMSEAIHAMCEGELLHVCQRRNLDMSKDSYIVIAQKKTASLFAACCHAGAIIGGHGPALQAALKEFGLNFGVAFQLIDDCRDVIREQADLGKCPGQDVLSGDVTLPILALSKAVGRAQRQEIQNMLGSANDRKSLMKLRAMLADSNALATTRQVVASYLDAAQKKLDILADSVYKGSLGRLVDYIAQETF